MSDYIMCVGVKYYPWPKDFSDEARDQGVSKAVSGTAIPYIEPGRSRLGLIHPRAIVYVNAEGMSLFDLGMELVNEYVPEPPADIKAELVARWITTPEASIKDWKHAMVHEKMLDADFGELPFDYKETSKLGMCESLRAADLAGDLERLEEKYGIEYGLGFIGYAYLSGMQYCLRDEEDALPAELAGKGIEAVRVVYEEVG